MSIFFKVSLKRVLLAGVLLLMLQSQVLAGTGWFTCKVELAGPAENFSFVNLTDQTEAPAFTGKWFRLPPAKAREMLAVALMAVSTGKRVVVVVDPEDGDYPEISNMFLQAGQ